MRRSRGIGYRLFSPRARDQVISLVIAAVIIWGTWSLLRDSLDLALHAVPRRNRIARGEEIPRSSSARDSSTRPSRVADEHDGNSVDRPSCARCPGLRLFAVGKSRQRFTRPVSNSSYDSAIQNAGP